MGIKKEKAPEPERYDCGNCGVKVDVEKSGRYWSSGHKKWLCGACFDLLVLGAAATS